MRVAVPACPEILKCFKTIRKHAVFLLKKETYETIESKKIDAQVKNAPPKYRYKNVDKIEEILLQLVQALRYEDLNLNDPDKQTGLRKFLFEIAMAVPSICHSLHWHMYLESQSKEN